MIARIKKRIDKTLDRYVRSVDRRYSLRRISPALSSAITGFLSRPGKRLRPVLFVIGYLGYSRRPAKNLYESALSMELLHDFLLVHDDIIDRSDLRRGLPSMHRVLERYARASGAGAFGGAELAIVAGDIIYAMAVDALLSIRAKPARKIEALKVLDGAMISTAGGEFIELLAGARGIADLPRGRICDIYRLKTSDYSFSAPLAMGAVLGGAGRGEIARLKLFGAYAGRAFQIRDDILDMFGAPKETGKSSMTDLKESKKTLLMWHAYRRSAAGERRFIGSTLSKSRKTAADLEKIRRIVRDSGALGACNREISSLISEAEKTLASLKMSPGYRSALLGYIRSLLRH